MPSEDGQVRESIETNVDRVKERIAAACSRSGRDAREVSIVGVTKTFGPEAVDALIAAGIADIGENRIQEFLEKSQAVTRPCRWHFVGTLQRNKAKKAIGRFELIHSVDNLALARTLDRLGLELGVSTRILFEVNTSAESTKHGFDPKDLVQAAEAASILPSLSIEGLMTVGPLADDDSAIRRSFSLLRGLRDRTEASLGKRLVHLSMGMSDDFEIAVEEGATLVRLGRVLLGARPG
jgi:pyridoxal phosphate enzyme (YggS family)